jgi:hypothetical protein
LAGIWRDESAGTWLIEMRSTCYAFGLADQGDGGQALRHLHWGAALPRTALVPGSPGSPLDADGGQSRRERRLSLGRECSRRASWSLEEATGTEHAGAVLMHHGLPLPEERAADFGSTLTRLRAVS